ncbi:MAG: hypothetical protein HY507_02045 [Candidatus Zambryskibacteria bacterium]|nr:hypothetical protein [Candidatus Zambryskibacteria bacterium]
MKGNIKNGGKNMTKERMGEIAVQILKSDAMFSKGIEELSKKARLYAKLTQQEATEFSQALHDVWASKDAQRRLRDQLALKHAHR